MQSKDELLRSAQRIVSLRRQQAVMTAQENLERARQQIPGYAAAADTISQAGYRAARLAASGAGSAAVERALAESQAAQTRCFSLLREHGWDPNALRPQYTCPICQDTGLQNGRICACVRALQQQQRREEIIAASALNISSFDSMSPLRYPEVYDPTLGGTVRQYMTARLAELRQYAESFSRSSTSLLLCGTAGLGKTHAALAIAGVVLDKGYDVIYISSQELFGHLDKVRFDKNDDGQDTMMDAVLSADLLILDDLGTEFISPYISSCLYTIVNSRICRKQPTIYTTNITDTGAFESRYTEKIASRLTGSCEPVYFFGADIRQMAVD